MPTMDSLHSARERVACPKCGAQLLLDTLRYSHTCKPRGRPRKYTRDGSPYTSAVAAMELRLRIRESCTATAQGEAST